MDSLTLLLIAFGLSMDAFAVSIINGITIQRQRANHALKIGIFFGSFQALMPLIGWSTGLSFRELISGVDHWVAFGLLGLIGSKMIYESTKITLILSSLGVLIGNKIGHFFEKKIEILGGLILIGIGIKILLEHLLP
jgi:putative Mn2+ efflux pump MntP